MTARRRWLASAAAAAACVAGLAACSDGSDSPAQSDGPEAPTQSDERDRADELLRSEGYLDDSGAVALGLAGPGGDETDVHEAMCTYLFGAPDEVAERAGLDEATLTDGSGYRMLGANGSGIECGWGSADEPVLVLASWGSADRFDGAEDIDVLVDLPDGVGVASYHPGSDVERLTEDELAQWLTEAPAFTQSV
ncbi:MAG: hypothetical protein ACTHW7_04960 [Actinomycetaceae bacterium]